MHSYPMLADTFHEVGSYHGTFSVQSYWTRYCGEIIDLLSNSSMGEMHMALLTIKAHVSPFTPLPRHVCSDITVSLYSMTHKDCKLSGK